MLTCRERWKLYFCPVSSKRVFYSDKNHTPRSLCTGSGELRRCTVILCESCLLHCRKIHILKWVLLDVLLAVASSHVEFHIQLFSKGSLVWQQATISNGYCWKSWNTRISWVHLKFKQFMMKIYVFGMRSSNSRKTLIFIDFSKTFSRNPTNFRHVIHIYDIDIW